MLNKIDETYTLYHIEGLDENGISQKVTQDVYFYRRAAKKGYKFACDCKILVGHYDSDADKIW